jgi:hypothetical protein
MEPLKKGDIIKKCNYTFIRERPAIGIEAFKGHKRLKVFFHKGFACVTPRCTNVGTRLIYSQAINGRHNWDLFTDDLIMMTVDHIVAKKNGGGNEIENLQPMCCHCNSIKGHQVITLDELADQKDAWNVKKAKEADKKREIRKKQRQKQKDRNDPVVIAHKQEERRLKKESVDTLIAC